MSYDTTAPIPGWPPAQPEPPRPRQWRVRPRWALVAGGVALVALIAGLLVWQPWNPPPNAPTAIHVVSQTATSADVSWSASKGGGKPEPLHRLPGRQEGGRRPGQPDVLDG
jgi:hypothetical protein